VPGQTLEVAPGLLWLRLALPFRLDHVNVYLVADGAGWAVIGAGQDQPQYQRAGDGSALASDRR
jgi:hypothetical protein